MFHRHATSCLLLLILSTSAVRAAGLASPETLSPLSLKPAQINTLGIETLTLGTTTTAHHPRIPARVQIPNEQIRIVSSPTGGLITQLLVAPGDRVRRGQVVARLSSPHALELQRDVRLSSSQASLLEQNLRRDEQLYAEGLIPESRLQATRAASTQARAQAQERRTSLTLAGMSLEGNTVALLAPLDGVVLEQGVQTGQPVEATSPIYKIARLTPLWLEIQSPAALSTQLRPGLAVHVAGYTPDTLKARLLAVGRHVDAASQTVLLRAIVSQGAEQLIPGQLLEVSLDISTSTGKAATVALPSQALIRHEGQSYVFVQQSTTAAATQFAARAVKVEQQGQDTAQVSGVSAGEKIAVKGVSALKALLTGVGKE